MMAEQTDEEEEKKKQQTQTSIGIVFDHCAAQFEAIDVMKDRPSWFRECLSFATMIPGIETDQAHSDWSRGSLKYSAHIRSSKRLFAALAHSHIYGTFKYRLDKSNLHSKPLMCGQLSGWTALFWFLFCDPVAGLDLLIYIENKFKADSTLETCEVSLLSIFFFLLFREMK